MMNRLMFVVLASLSITLCAAADSTKARAGVVASVEDQKAPPPMLEWPVVAKDQKLPVATAECTAEPCAQYMCCSRTTGNCTASVYGADWCGKSAPIKGACLCNCSAPQCG